MNPKILELMEKLKLNPKLAQTMEALKQIYLTNPKLRPEVEKAVLYWAKRYRNGFHLRPPPEDKAQGDYPIGSTYSFREGHPFGLKESEMLKHIGIYGMTGAGKTEALDVLLSEVLKDKKSVMIFDWDGSHRHLLGRPEGKDLLYFTIGSTRCPFPFNPNRVPDSFSYSKRISYLGSLYFSLVERTFQNQTLNKEGVKFLLTRVAEELIKEGNLNFTFKAMYEKAKEIKVKEREREWRTTLLNFLTRFTTGPLNKVFNSKAHIPTGTLLGEQVLFDLQNLINPVEKADFIECFLSHLYECHLKGRKQVKSVQLKILFVIEEVHNILTARGGAIINSFFREMRKWGGGLVITDQHPSLVPRQVRGNCYCTISQNLESPEDIRTLGPTLLLKRRDLPYLGDEESYLSRIPTASGLYLVKLQGRYTRPFLVKIRPLKKKRKEIPSQVLKRKMLGYLSKLGIDIGKLAERKDIRLIWDQDKGEVKEVKEVSREARKLLKDIGKHPYSKVTERYERLGLDTYRAHQVKKELIKKGFVKQQNVTTGQGRVALLRLTEKGGEILEITDRLTSDKGKGGMDHELVKDQLAIFLDERGWETIQKEKEDIDLTAQWKGKRIAFEVETGKSNYVRNIFRDLKLGCDIVVAVALSSEVKKEIREKLASMEDSGVDFKDKVFVLGRWEVEDFVRKYLEVVL